jgi:hypothetical protein
MASYDYDDVQHFMTGYGLALATGDLDKIATCYAFPALILHDDGVLLLASQEVVHDSFRDSAQRRRAAGLVAAVPHIVAVEATGAALVWADVRWSYPDENADERDSESYRYVLRRVREGFEICVAAQLAESPAPAPGATIVP